MMAVILIPWALSVKPTQAGCNAFCRCPRCEKSRLGVDSSFKKATWPTPDFSSVTPSANVQSKTTAFITRAVKPVLSGGGYKAPRLLCSKLRKIRCIISTMRTYKYKLLSAKRNQKLHRQINAGALAWNHCVAVTRRFYRFYGKSVSENALKKHLTKLKKRVPYGLNFPEKLHSSAMRPAGRS